MATSDQNQDLSLSLKRALHSADWWPLVQEEVKLKLEFVVNNLGLVGVLFRDAFVSLFKMEHARRILDKSHVKPNQPGALFGKLMSEEVYQCGIQPTKAILHLDDWTRPNDADVQACVHICQQVEAFEALGIFVKNATETISWDTDKPKRKKGGNS